MQHTASAPHPGHAVARSLAALQQSQIRRLTQQFGSQIV
jgi:hypothetical protein